MEEVYRFPLLRFKPSDLPPPPFVIPAKAGIQRRANGKTGGKPWGNAINRIVPDLDSRFRGNDGKRDCVYIPIYKKNHSKRFSPTLSPFIPYFFKRLLGIENLLQFLPSEGGRQIAIFSGEKRSLFSPGDRTTRFFFLYRHPGRAT